jgi:glycosyltransferase involved in cell wall biosynthesis
MPFALLEGMSCGKSIVAMGVGGVTEIVEVGTTGLLSASGDWMGLANALLKLLKEPEQLKAMGAAARERVVERFDLENSIKRMANLFRHLAGTNLPDKRLSQGDLVQDSWPAASPGQDLVPVDPGKVFPRALK